MSQLKLPLHGAKDPLSKITLWVTMASINPKGFRNLSDKKNRRRSKSANPRKIALNGRFLSRPEQYALEMKA